MPYKPIGGFAASGKEWHDKAVTLPFSANWNPLENPMRHDLGGDWGRMLLHVGSVIEPLAAYCEAIRGHVAALVILTRVGPVLAPMRGWWVAGYSATVSGAMRWIRCLRVGSSLPVAGAGAVIVPVSTD